MVIGIVPQLNGEVGGVYQYCLNILHALNKIGLSGKYKFILFSNLKKHSFYQEFDKNYWQIAPLFPSGGIKSNLQRIIQSFIPTSIELPPKYNQSMSKYFQKFHLDLMIYPTSDTLSFETGIPYIFTIHDLNHRIYNEFPEVSAPNEWKAREYSFRNGIKNALYVLVDSKIGKEDVLRFYPDYVSNPEKIQVLPYLPAGYLKTKLSEKHINDVRKKYKLPSKYLFYPARFWPHKNHLRIIEALGLLRKKYKLEIPIVFCGSHTGIIRETAFKQVMSKVIQLELSKNILYLGYVEDKDMSVLYTEAHALIMPTFFGPTNIPIVEAWQFGCPVITSDIRGIREQSGKAALLVNPRSVDSIANCIKEVWEDKNLRNELAKLGKKRLANFDKDDYNKRLSDIINEAKDKINKIN